LHFALENFPKFLIKIFFYLFKIFSHHFLTLFTCCFLAANTGSRGDSASFGQNQGSRGPWGVLTSSKRSFLFSIFFLYSSKRSNYKDPFLSKEAKSLKRTLVLCCNSAIKAGPLCPVSSSPLGGFVLWVWFFFCD
jgi:hypothetical protein